MFKKDLEPTDFAESELRVTKWCDFSPDYAPYLKQYRIWVCRVGRGYWFQRHEWSRSDRNSTDLEKWIFYGYYPLKKWDDGLMVPEEEI